jgi:DNA-binding SARP family transcriptional activator
VKYAGGSVITFEVLGEVTARQDAWVAKMSTQQQHLLAALVLGGGAPVTRERLEEILWDFRVPYPEKGVARVASGVRAILQEAAPSTNLVLSSHGGYRLLMAPEQADILRFRTIADKARGTSGRDSAQLMRQALREWGPNAVGLYGGSLLEGLPGQWADSTRHLLQTQYRDAVVHCLTYEMSCHDYGPVLAECERRAADSASALLDDEFLSLWILAAMHAGDLARARTVYRRAQDAARYSNGHLSPALQQLGTRLRDSGTALATPAVSPQPIPVITGQEPTIEHVADEESEGPSATGQPSDVQLGSVFNADVYLNIAGVPTGSTSKVQAQVNVAREPGTTVFGVQGGNIYHYQGIPKHLPPAPATGDADGSEGRSESA